MSFDIVFFSQSFGEVLCRVRELEGRVLAPQSIACAMRVVRGARHDSFAAKLLASQRDDAVWHDDDENRCAEGDAVRATLRAEAAKTTVASKTAISETKR